MASKRCSNQKFKLKLFSSLWQKSSSCKNSTQLSKEFAKEGFQFHPKKSLSLVIKELFHQRNKNIPWPSQQQQQQQRRGFEFSRKTILIRGGSSRPPASSPLVWLRANLSWFDWEKTCLVKKWGRGRGGGKMRIPVGSTSSWSLLSRSWWRNFRLRASFCRLFNRQQCFTLCSALPKLWNFLSLLSSDAVMLSPVL